MRDIGIVQNYAEEPDPPAPLEFLEAADALMAENNIHFPQTVLDAIDVHITVVSFMESEIDN